jgi:hypothetical protein
MPQLIGYTLNNFVRKSAPLVLLSLEYAYEKVNFNLISIALNTYTFMPSMNVVIVSISTYPKDLGCGERLTFFLYIGLLQARLLLGL